jgi:ATP-dependent DNA helicase RecG
MSESQHVEWKLVWRDDYLRWICGFANAEGGTLVLGRDDRGAAVGVGDAERLLAELPNKIRDLLGLVVPVRAVEVDGCTLVEIDVAPQPTPISYRGEYHVRSGSTKQQLTGAALSAFLLRKLGRHWDGAPYPGVAAGELEPDAFRRFRRRAALSGRLSDDDLRAPDAELLDRLKLTEGGLLKRAALLLFHPEPERFCTGACVKIGLFASESDLRHQDVVEGNLFKQLDDTLDVLRLKYLRARITYAGVQRLETFPVPEAALREALLNALVHKDYASGAPVQIRVYTDRLAVMNAGALPPGWTLETLLRPHPSLPPNPDLAHAFFRAGAVEAWGRGVEKIREACLAAGSPPPVLTHDGAALRLEFPFSEAAARAQAESGAESGAESQPESRSALAPILQFLATQPASKVEIARALGRSRISGALNATIRRLLADGLVEQTRPETPNSRLQQYRLTPRGQARLDEGDPR